MTKIIDSTNLGYLISKMKSAFWPKSDVVQIGLDNSPTSGSDNLVKSGGVYSALGDKQDTLVSGTNIKTINNESILGSGNITVSAGSSVTESTVSGWGFTKNTGTLTGVKVNGSNATVTSGVADIGTVITSETQLSKGTTSGSGNAVTDISVSNHQITLTKGSTFLTSHQSIKTINNQTITGTGNLTLDTLPTVSASDNGKILMVVNGAWTLVSPVTIYSGSGEPNNSMGNNGDIYLQT